MPQHPTPVFILGSGRSGTTVTATLLNRLPGVHLAKETGYIGLSLPMLRRIDDPDILTQLVDTVNSWLNKERWEHLASADGFHSFCSRYGLSGASAFMHYIWQLDASVPWHELEFIGDNTPLYVMAIPAIQELLPNARFIHMVRDPRDVVCSICKMRFGADDLVAAAMEWHLYLGCWLMAERVVAPERRMECRYEDLCTHSEQAFALLAAFLNRTSAQASAALAAHAAAAGSDPGFRNVSGLTHHTRISEPLTPSRIGRYRTELSVDQITAIEPILQYGMLAYGYPPAQWHTHPLMREDRMSLLKTAVRDALRRISKRLKAR